VSDRSTVVPADSGEAGTSEGAADASLTGVSGILPSIGGSGFVPPVAAGRLTEALTGTEAVQVGCSSAEAGGLTAAGGFEDAGGPAERCVGPEPPLVGAEDTALSWGAFVAAGRGSDGAATAWAGRRS
jgi:hypothetical protein